jgi:hypothetical protein
LLATKGEHSGLPGVAIFFVDKMNAVSEGQQFASRLTTR